MVPSFFLTKTIGLDHRLFEGDIVCVSSISSTFSWTYLRSAYACQCGGMTDPNGIGVWTVTGSSPRYRWVGADRADSNGLGSSQPLLGPDSVVKVDVWIFIGYGTDNRLIDRWSVAGSSLVGPLDTLNYPLITRLIYVNDIFYTLRLTITCLKDKIEG